MASGLPYCIFASRNRASRPRDALFLTRKVHHGRRDALFLPRKARHGPREAKLAPKFKHYIRQLMVPLAIFLLRDRSLFTPMSCTSMFSEFAELHVVHDMDVLRVIRRRWIAVLTKLLELMHSVHQCLALPCPSFRRRHRLLRRIRRQWKVRESIL